MRHVLLALLLVFLLPCVVHSQAGWLQTEGAFNHSTPVLRDRPLAHGLVSWWRVLPLLDGVPRWYDLMSTNAATLTNMSTPGTSGWAPTQRRGGYGELRFDGTDDYADAGSPSSLTDVTRRTLLAWIKISSYGGGDLGRIVDKRFSGGWTFVTNNFNVTAGLSFTQDFSTSGGNWGLANVLSTDVWTHVGVVYDSTGPGTTPTFYVNGLPFAPTTTMSTPSGTTSTDSASPLRFGGEDGSGARQFAGVMDDVRLYRRLLSAAEVAEIYRGSVGTDSDLLHRLAPPLSVYYAPSGFLSFFP